MDPYPGRYAEQLVEPRHSWAWQLIKSYWQSEHRFPAYLFCTIVMAMTVSLVGLNVFFTYWYYYFYEVMQGYDKHGAVRLAAALITLAIIYAVWAVYRFYISRVVRTHGRRLTEQLIGRWLDRHGYRRAAHFDAAHPRLQKDVDSLVNFSIDLSMGLIGTLTTFFALTYILWQLSEEFAVSLGGWGTLHVPGYLVWAGVIYAAIGTFFTFKFGRPLLSLHHSKKEQPERETGRFVGKVKQKLLWLRVGGYQLTLIVPLLVVLPTFLDKVILVTWLIQSLQAFNRVQGSLSSIIKSHPAITNGNMAEM